MHIAILIGDNMYNTAAHFMRSLMDAWHSLGVKTISFPINEWNFLEVFSLLRKDPPQFTCSFSDIHMQQTPIAELLHIPHLSLLVDPAIYFLYQLKSPLSWVSCVDQDDCEWLFNAGQRQHFFLPHGAEKKLETDPNQQRDYEAVFFGSCLDYKKIEQAWPCKYPAKEVAQLQEAVQLVLSSNNISIFNALYGVGVRETRMAALFAEVDLYVRGKDRVALIAACMKCCRVDIWGNGPWRTYFPHASVHASIPFASTLEIMKNARLVLNSSPRFKAGAHERILYGLMCGANVLTGKTKFTEQFFAEDELLTYYFGEDASIQISDLESIRAKKGQEKVLSKHTWDHRAQTILETIPFL